MYIYIFIYIYSLYLLTARSACVPCTDYRAISSCLK